MRLAWFRDLLRVYEASLVPRPLESEASLVPRPLESEASLVPRPLESEASLHGSEGS